MLRFHIWLSIMDESISSPMPDMILTKHLCWIHSQYQPQKRRTPLESMTCISLFRLTGDYPSRSSNKNCRFVRGWRVPSRGLPIFRVEQIFGAGVRGVDSAILGKRAKGREIERENKRKSSQSSWPKPSQEEGWLWIILVPVSDFTCNSIAASSEKGREPSFVLEHSDRSLAHLTRVP